MSKNSYEYKLQFKKSTAHSNADALSQFPLPTAPATVPKPPEVVLLMNHLDFPQSVQQRLREKLVITHFYLMYYNLYYMVGQIYVIVMNPSHILGKAAGRNGFILHTTLHQRILLQLHGTHMGISHTYEILRENVTFVWWPGLDNKLEGMVRHCNICQHTRAIPPVAPLYPWIWPSRPWSRIHIDYTGGHRFLVVVNTHSKRIKVIPMSSTTYNNSYCPKIKSNVCTVWYS